MEQELTVLAGILVTTYFTVFAERSVDWAGTKLGALFRRWRRTEGEGDERDDAELTAEVEALLAADPEAAAEGRAAVGEALRREPAWAASALLSYVNNTALLREMDAHWQECRAAGVTTALFLRGIPGVGRRSTALQWVYLHRDDFDGEVLRADLGVRHGRVPEAAAVLEQWLQQLGVARQDRAAEVVEMAWQVRREVADRPVVFVLENVTTTRQIRDLLTAQPYGVVLMTGQWEPHDLHTAVENVRPLQVLPLPEEHALELLAGLVRTPEDPARLRPIVRYVGALPLALRLVAERLRAPIPGVLEDVTAQLAERTTRQELLDVGEMNPLPDALDVCYRGMDPRTARLYRRLGLLVNEEFQLDVVHALTPGRPAAEVRAALGSLVSAGLVEMRGIDTYHLPVLVHDHATTAALREESEETRAEVRRLIVRHVLRYAEEAQARLARSWRHDPLYAGDFDAGESSDVPEADVLREMARREALVFATVDLAVEAELYGEAWRLAQGTWSYCLKAGAHSRWIASRGTALEAAQRTGDRLAEARMEYELGFAHLDRWAVEEGDAARAREHFGRALALVDPGAGGRGEGERRTESSVLEGLGLLERKLRQPARALGRFEEARTALAGIGHPRGEALLLLHIGGTYLELERHNDAARELAEAARRFTAAPLAPDPFNIAKVRHLEARNHRACGRLREAVASLDAAADGMREAGSDYWTGVILVLRGRIHRELGEHARAADDWRAARTHYRKARSGKGAAEAQGLLEEEGED